MANRSKQSEQSGSFWRTRAAFAIGTTRRQRQQQYKQQMSALWTILAVSIVFGALFVFINWRNVSAVKELSCAAFPQFCVPLAGEADPYPGLEAASSRVMDFDSVENTAVDGVVRYIGSHNEPRIGDPSAPIHFVTVSDFACPHCQDFHGGDLVRFFDEYVLTGKATFGFTMSTGTGRDYSRLASQAALCAGEQGAFWEYSEELFHAADSRSIYDAFTLDGLRDMARDMGLDDEQLDACVASGQYEAAIADYLNFALDNGVTGTPTVLVQYAGSNQWTPVSRSWDSLSQLVEAANSGE